MILSLINGKDLGGKLILDVFSAVLDELNLKLVAMVPAKPRGVCWSYAGLAEASFSLL